MSAIRRPGSAVLARAAGLRRGERSVSGELLSEGLYALMFGQAHLIAPAELREDSLGGELAADESGGERRDGVGVAAELHRRQQGRSQGARPTGTVQRRHDGLVRVQAHAAGWRPSLVRKRAQHGLDAWVSAGGAARGSGLLRSEERRVGKECRSRWS